MLGLIIFILVTAGLWKIFEKAGTQGWKALIPFYNGYVLITQVAGKQWWYFLLLFVPIVNFIVIIIINIEIAKAFGKSALYGVIGLSFFSFIFYPLLGFGDAVFRKNYERTEEHKVIDETLYVDEKKPEDK